MIHPKLGRVAATGAEFRVQCLSVLCCDDKLQGGLHVSWLWMVWYGIVWYSNLGQLDRQLRLVQHFIYFYPLPYFWLVQICVVGGSSPNGRTFSGSVFYSNTCIQDKWKYVCMHTYIHTIPYHTIPCHTYIYTYIHNYTRVCIYVYIYTYIQTHI